MSVKVNRYKRKQIVDDRSIRAKDPVRIADARFDGKVRRGRSDSRQRHRRGGCAAECGGLGDFPSARTIGIASHLSPKLHGKAGGTLQDQAASGAYSRRSLSKRHLDVFNKLPSLRLW